MAKFDMDWMERFRAVANANKTLKVLLRPVEVTFLLEFGERSYLVTIADDEVKPIENARALGLNAHWQFAIRGPEESWEKNTREIPPPEFTDIIFMSFNNHIVIEGNLLPMWQCIRALLWMLDLMRQVDRPVTA